MLFLNQYEKLYNERKILHLMLISVLLYGLLILITTSIYSGPWIPNSTNLYYFQEQSIYFDNHILREHKIKKNDLKNMINYIDRIYNFKNIKNNSYTTEELNLTTKYIMDLLHDDLLYIADKDSVQQLLNLKNQLNTINSIANTTYSYNIFCEIPFLDIHSISFQYYNNGAISPLFRSAHSLYCEIYLKSILSQKSNTICTLVFPKLIFKDYVEYVFERNNEELSFICHNLLGIGIGLEYGKGDKFLHYHYSRSHSLMIDYTNQLHFTLITQIIFNAQKNLQLIFNDILKINKDDIYATQIMNEVIMHIKPLEYIGIFLGITHIYDKYAKSFLFKFGLVLTI